MRCLHGLQQELQSRSVSPDHETSLLLKRGRLYCVSAPIMIIPPAFIPSDRIEHPIGRSKRYGPKFGMTVVNTLNLKNQMDQRIHELLSQSFYLFESVFGRAMTLSARWRAGLISRRTSFGS